MTAPAPQPIQVTVLAQHDGYLSLNAFLPGRFLAAGMAVFIVLGDRLICDQVFVEAPCRRRGIASELYRAAEAHFGRKVEPSTKLTPESVAFWRARGVAAPPGAEVKPYEAWT